jgi:hypothetical protein
MISPQRVSGLLSLCCIGPGLGSRHLALAQPLPSETREAMTREPRSDRLTAMTTLEDIEKAVTELPTDHLAILRARFEEFEATRFDQRIERDAKTGRLDQLAEQALADYRAGRACEL